MLVYPELKTQKQCLETLISNIYRLVTSVIVTKYNIFFRFCQMWEFPVKSRQYYDYFSILATVCLLVRADVFKIISGLVSERLNSLTTCACYWCSLVFVNICACSVFAQRSYLLLPVQLLVILAANKQGRRNKQRWHKKNKPRYTRFIVAVSYLFLKSNSLDMQMTDKTTPTP